MSQNLYMNKFGERLKDLRLEKGLNYAQLAKEVGLHPTAIGLWEAGKRSPNLIYVVTLAKFFGVSVGYMAGEED